MAKGNVNAGDFVKFVNGELTTGADTKLSTDNSTGYVISATRLSENKVFIAHGYSNLYGMVCEVNGTNITVRTRYKNQ